MLRESKSKPWRRFGYPVLISIDFDDFTSPFTTWVLFRLRRYIKHSRQCFIGYPNTSNFVKNTPLRVVFSTRLGVWISRWNTVARVWYITYHMAKPSNGRDEPSWIILLCNWLPERANRGYRIVLESSWNIGTPWALQFPFVENWVSGDFISVANGTASSKFPQDRDRGRVPEFSEICVPFDFPFWLKGSPFGNSTTSGFSGKFF